MPKVSTGRLSRRDVRLTHLRMVVLLVLAVSDRQVWEWDPSFSSRFRLGGLQKR